MQSRRSKSTLRNFASALFSYFNWFAKLSEQFGARKKQLFDTLLQVQPKLPLRYTTYFLDVKSSKIHSKEKVEGRGVIRQYSCWKSSAFCSRQEWLVQPILWAKIGEIINLYYNRCSSNWAGSIIANFLPLSFSLDFLKGKWLECSE